MIKLTINWTDKNGKNLTSVSAWGSMDAAKWYVGEFQAFNPGCYRSHSIA